MKRIISFKIKADDSHLRNEMHFAVQRSFRAEVFRPKKGKGSFRRNAKHRLRDAFA